MVRLGDVCEINLGKTPPRGSRDCWDPEKSSGNVWVSISDMSNLIGGKIDDSKEYITRYAIESVGVPVVSKGTLLLSFKLTLGRTAIAGCDLYTNEAIAALPVKNDFKRQIDIPFLSTYFAFFDWNGFAAKDEKLLGKTLNKKKLAEIPIPLPPLPVQREIVARLEKELGEADALAAKFKEIAENADAEFKAELDESFKNVEGEKVNLGDVCEIQRGGSPRPIKKYLTDAADGLNWIKIGDVAADGKYIVSVEDKIKPSGLNKTRRVRSGDFLLSNSMSFGRPYILKIDGCIHDGWLVLHGFQDKFTEDYFYYLLRSSLVQAQFDSLAHGSSVRNLNTGAVSVVEVTQTPIGAQQSIVSKLESAKLKCEKLKAAAERGLRAAEDLRKAILAEAFEQ